MKAVVYEQFQGNLILKELPDPRPENDDVIIKVLATGLCRSDWHGWMGHDPDIQLPHVPGHEFVGTIIDKGENVKSFNIGDRVTTPFVCGCGRCPQCETGNQQVCDNQTQPGFTHWGSFAEFVQVKNAEINLVKIPDPIDNLTAVSLGCRFVTSYRAIVDQGKLAPGEYVAVHGCGGVGLSAIMIAKAFGANVIAIDIKREALQKAKSIGADFLIESGNSKEIVEKIKHISSGGANLSVDALGHQTTCFNSIDCLAKRGRHIQVGLMAGEHQKPVIPMDKVIAFELEVIGSHGMQAHKYPDMLKLILEGKLNPGKLVGSTIKLSEALKMLPEMNRFETTGMIVIDDFT